jgi:hypothetical protein
MSEPLPAPKFLKVYLLVRQLSHLYFSPSGGGNNIGTGFYFTRDEAEKQRTMELLTLADSAKDKFYIFELDIPNPAYTE